MSSLIQATKKVNSNEFLAGWGACCNCGTLDLETDSAEFQRGFVAAWRAGELDDSQAMGQYLDALRAGKVEPMARLTNEQYAEIEDERIGHEFCTTAGTW